MDENSLRTLRRIRSQAADLAKTLKASQKDLLDTGAQLMGDQGFMSASTLSRLQTKSAQYVSPSMVLSHLQVLEHLARQHPTLSHLAGEARRLQVEAEALEHGDLSPVSYPILQGSTSIEGSWADVPAEVYMGHVYRDIEAQIVGGLRNEPGKPIIVYGPRASGKTAVLQSVRRQLEGQYQVVRIDMEKKPDSFTEFFSLLAFMSHPVWALMSQPVPSEYRSWCSEHDYQACVQQLVESLSPGQRVLFLVDDFDLHFDSDHGLCKDLCSHLRAWADASGEPFSRVDFLLAARVHPSRHGSLTPSRLYPRSTFLRLDPLTPDELMRSQTSLPNLPDGVSAVELVEQAAGLVFGIARFYRALAAGADESGAQGAMNESLRELARATRERVARTRWSERATDRRRRVERWHNAIRGQTQLPPRERVRLYELGALLKIEGPIEAPHPVFFGGDRL